MAMLGDTRPGTFLPADVACFDPAEVDALGGLLSRLVYAPSSLRQRLQDRHGVTLTRADFYSAIPTITELEQSFADPSLLRLDDIFPDPAMMIAELDRLFAVSHEFDPPRRAGRAGEYAWEGGPFSYSDAMAYYCMIRTRQPRTIVEIGGGWSTLIARLACERNGSGRVVCIEPYPTDFLRDLPGVELIARRIQDVETATIDGLLQDGDMLSIDSTHTVKHDSDCLHIYLRILPGIAASLTVHAHDIYLPQTPSLAAMRDEQIFWAEQYLLYACLRANPRTRVLFGSWYHWLHNRDRLEQLMHGRFNAGGASFWFAQAGRGQRP